MALSLGVALLIAVVSTPAVRRIVLGAVLLVLAIGCGTRAPEPPTEAESHLPDGYALRLDRPNRKRSDFGASLESGRLQIQTGPAGILYELDRQLDASDFRVGATFTQLEVPMGHREGYGLFVGGQDLAGPGQRYLCFLVRADGRYLVKRRDGESTTELSGGWQPSDAVSVPAEPGAEVTNALAVEASDGQLRLLCNGEAVAELAVEPADLAGVVGLRVNHNLRVRVDGFGTD